MISAVAAQNPSLQKKTTTLIPTTHNHCKLRKKKRINIYIQDSFLCQQKRKSNKMEKNNNKVEITLGVST